MILISTELKTFTCKFLLFFKYSSLTKIILVNFIHNYTLLSGNSHPPPVQKDSPTVDTNRLSFLIYNGPH